MHVPLWGLVYVVINAGGAYRSWNKRYFVLKGSRLIYYKEKDDPQPKDEIDLTTGRGVREQCYCHNIEWPWHTKYNLTFGVATEARTYYLIGEDKTDVA